MLWIVLARDPASIETFENRGFNEELLKRIDATPIGLGQLVSKAATEGGYRYSAVGTCEVDATRDARGGHNVISFSLEQSDA